MPSRLISASNWKPSIIGMSMSVITTSTGSFNSNASASSPFFASMTRTPSVVS